MENTFFDISTTLLKDLITFHSFNHSSQNIEDRWSHLGHTIIFKNFTSYLIYNILEIISQNQNTIIHLQDVFDVLSQKTMYTMIEIM